MSQCTEKGITLEELTLKELKAVSPFFGEDVYDALRLENCMSRRSCYGGPAPEETARQIQAVEAFIKAHAVTSAAPQ